MVQESLFNNVNRLVLRKSVASDSIIYYPLCTAVVFPSLHKYISMEFFQVMWHRHVNKFLSYLPGLFANKGHTAVELRSLELFRETKSSSRKQRVRDR